MNGTTFCTGATPNCVNLPGSYVCNNCTGEQINGAGSGGCIGKTKVLKLGMLNIDSI